MSHEQSSRQAEFMTKQKAERSIAVLTVSNLVMAASNLVAALLLARLFAPDDRGKLASAFAAFMIVRMIGQAGWSDAANRCRDWFPDASAARVLRSVGRPAFVASIVLSLGALGLVSLLFGRGEALEAFVIMLPFVPLFVLADAGRAVLLNEGTPARAAFILAAPRVIRALGVAALVFAGIERVSLAALVSVIGVVVTLPIVARLWGGVLSADALDRPQIFSFVRRAAPAAAGGMLDRRLDQVILVAIASADEAGFYAVAVALAEVPSLLLRATRMVLLAGGRQAQFRRLASGTLAAVTAASIIIGLAAPFVVPIAFGDRYEAAGLPAMVLCLGTALFAIAGLADIALIISDTPERAIPVRFASIGVGTVALLLLAPTHGALGAAIAATIAYLVAAILMVRQARQVWQPAPAGTTRPAVDKR